MREPVDQRSSSEPGVLQEAGSVLGSAAHGAGSMLKTGVLRRDRVSEADYQARLGVCRDCPGGHAQFKSDGRLHTCGPMLESMKGSGASGGEGQGTCGCVLSKKARDAAEACPFGYWPTLEQTRLERVSLPVLNARAGKLMPVIPLDEAAVPQTRLARWRSRLGEPVQRLRARHQHWASNSAPPDPSRRRFFQRAAGGLAGLVGLMTGWPRVWAQEQSECYVKVSPCENGKYDWVECNLVDGMEVGDYIRSNDELKPCYELLGEATDNPPEEDLIMGAASSVTDCDDSTCCMCPCWPPPSGSEDPCLLEQEYFTQFTVKHTVYGDPPDCEGDVVWDCAEENASATVSYVSTSPCRWEGLRDEFTYLWVYLNTDTCNWIVELEEDSCLFISATAVKETGSTPLGNYSDTYCLFDTHASTSATVSEVV